MLATCVTQIYLPMFYEIKVKDEIKYGPWNLVKLFRLWNQQNETIRYASKQYLKKESWRAHSENILVALLSSDATDERIFVVDIIFKLRVGNNHGFTPTRPFKVPETESLMPVISQHFSTRIKKPLLNQFSPQKYLLQS